MRGFFRYVYLQGKRTARYFPFVLAITLCICLSLALVLNTLLAADADSEKNQRVSIGIVGDADESFLGFGIAAVQSLDSSRFSLDLREMTEETAKSLLRRGEIIGYVVIPEGFVHDAVRGNVAQIPYVTTGSSAGLAALFENEILQAISVMLVESQKGVYGLEALMRENGIAAGSSLDRLASDYFSLILNRNSVLNTQIVGVGNGLSFGGYMLCGLTVLLILIGCVPCCSLLIRRDRALSRLMAAQGRGAFFQAAGEYIPLFLMMLLNFALLSAVFRVALAGTASLIPELEKASLLVFLLRLIPVVLAITAMQLMLCEVCTEIVSGVLLQFLCAMGLGYVSGCMYPIGFFPDAIRALSSVLPTGIARSYLAACFTGDNAVWELVGLLGYAVLFFAVTACIRRARMIRG